MNILEDIIFKSSDSSGGPVPPGPNPTPAPSKSPTPAPSKSPTPAPSKYPTPAPSPAAPTPIPKSPTPAPKPNSPTPPPSPHAPTPPRLPCDPAKTKRCRKGCEKKDETQDDCDGGFEGEPCWWGEPPGGYCMPYNNEKEMKPLICSINNVILPEDNYIDVGICKTDIPTPAPTPSPAPTPCSKTDPKCNPGCPGPDCKCRKPGQSCWQPLPDGGECCQIDPNSKYDMFDCFEESKNRWLPAFSTDIGVCKALPHEPGKAKIGESCGSDTDCEQPYWLECCRGICSLVGSHDPGSC